MNHADFVHLHNHSDYSLLDGASSIPRMVERAAQLRLPALALTDHGSLFGAVEFYQEARRAGVKPILGMEAYVTRGDRHEKSARDTAHHLVLLARDEQGFRNLMRLSSFAFLEGFYYKPRVDHALLAAHSAGLLALSACPKGEVASDLLDDNEERAYQTAMMYREMFGAENYFLEIQNHGLEIEDRIRARVGALARRTGIPRVATNDCHYLRHEDADAHDLLLCIQTGKTVDDAKRLQMHTDQLHFRTPEEMKAAFPDDPDAIRNTLAVAERCNLQLAFGRPLLPEFPLPANVESPERYLRDLAEPELAKRYPGTPQAVRERFEYELDVICRMGFASYFLIVRDFIAYARRSGIAVGPGRGSVAGSLVAYLLRITDIDPLQHGLIFERFLNPERVSMPDIDIDFDDLRRSEVIAYVKDKYGEGNVTQIITFGTMGAKGVVRDVGRALGLAFAEVDRIAKLVPEGLGMTLERALELSPDLKGLPQRGPVYARLLRSARALEGLARHASTHAAGVLITPGPLLDYVPLYRQKDESVTTQWDMKAVEKAGLLKMDFLGLRTLSVLQHSVALVTEKERAALDLLALPLDDAAAYEVFQRGDTVAIFQFESSGMRDYLRQLKPSAFGDLVAMNALYRPGPMEHIPYFIECKHGRQVARYEHADLEPILKGTYGVFVYQEQVMQAANTLAGFSMAQADELRRAMGKKKPEEMEAKRAQFIDGCKRNKIPAAKAEKIFATMEKFAGYGFNRCVSGETRVMDATSGEVTTVADLFHHRREFRIHALGEDWKLRPRRVTDVVWNGRKPVFELRTAQDKRITATANHPFRTLDGWKRLDELAPGDRIAGSRQPDVDTRVDSRASDRYPAAAHPARGRRLREDAEGYDSGCEKDVALALDVESRSESERLAAIADSDVSWDRIVSIEPRGVEDTYDLTVEHDHNFVANGLVVHNSHSAAYAMLAYQCAWLKAHHPAEFMAATLTSEMSDSARIVTLIEECRRLKLEILAPDVNRSEWRFTLESGSIRFGLGAVRNVGQGAVDAVVAARVGGGAFRDLFDLVVRVDSRTMNRRVLESLIAAGACDALGPERGAMHAAAGRVLEQVAALQRDRQSGQSSLFGEGGEGGVAVVAPPIPASPPWGEGERSAREKEVLGFYFSQHPLEPLREGLAKIVTHSIAEALQLEDGAEVRVGAVVIEVKKITTRTGKAMAGVTLEDLTGRCEATVFPETWEATREWLVEDRVVVISGRMESGDRGIKLLVSEVRTLEQARSQYRPCLHIEIKSEDLSVGWLEEVDETLSGFPGEAEVYLHILMPDRSRKASRSKRYRVSEDDRVVGALRERFTFVRVGWGKGLS
ncbi:MAG TPA: DNA polymerase III subunit alpha [Candidatus Eisenbacteria bacterium]|jgi:DNA polymerase-3 subunit alpha